MDILRHTGRAQLSSFVGGSPANRAMDRDAVADRALHRGRPAGADRQRAEALYGADGRSRSSTTSQAYVDGINAYIDEALARPDASCRPSTPRSASCREHWKLTDVIAEASLIGGIFGKGGGARGRLGADPAGVRQALRRAAPGGAPGATSARKNDPEAPTTVDGSASRTRPASPFAKRGLALPDPGSVTFDARRAAACPRRRRAAQPRRVGFGDIGAQLRARAREPGPRVQLGAGLRARVGDRPPDRRARPAGRLLRCRRS